jgi:hypothetical protein
MQIELPLGLENCPRKDRTLHKVTWGKFQLKTVFVTLLYSDSHRVLVADPSRSLFPTVFVSKIMAWFGLV